MRVKVFQKATNISDARLDLNQIYTLCFSISNNRVFISHEENSLYTYDLKGQVLEEDDNTEFLIAWELKRSLNSILEEILTDNNT